MKTPLYTCLWFRDHALEAATWYCSLFPNSSILSQHAVVVHFELNGTRFMALNGNNQESFNDSCSIVVPCDTQEEIDHLWNHLREGGTEKMCGWVTDRFGISWQIIPSSLGSWMQEPQAAKRVSDAFLKMKKMDIRILEEAYHGTR